MNIKKDKKYWKKRAGYFQKKYSNMQYKYDILYDIVNGCRKYLKQRQKDEEWSDSEWEAYCKEMREDIEFCVEELNKEIQKLNLDDSNSIHYYLHHVTLYITG